MSRFVSSAPVRSFVPVGFTFASLWPEDAGTASEDPNQNAVVLIASYGATDVYLSADAESDVTARLPLPDVEIMKVAHHGSEDPGSPTSSRRCARRSL